jgi:hypothetical protein
MAEGNGLAKGFWQHPPGIRRLAVVFHERQALVLGDFTRGKGVRLARVAEHQAVATVSLLQRRHDCALRSITATSCKPRYQEFTKDS